MCGICGIIASSPDRAGLREAIQRMMSALNHRGPDASGILERPLPAATVFLGHTRLSILDLSDRARQPMVAPDQSAIVFNGEIYNFAVLRQALERQGETFQSDGDSEVLLKYMVREGTKGLRELRGMFAFGLLNASSKTVVLARDELGIKPLYYYHDVDRGLFAFASEVRALLASGLVPRKISGGGLESLVAFGSAMQPWTIIRDVFALPAGTYVEVGDPRMPLRIQSYLPGTSGCLSEPAFEQENSDAERAFISALTESVSSHLVSDARLGCFLSGGLDSPSIALLASRERRLETFCLGVDSAELDESQDAAEIARKLGTQHYAAKLSLPDLAASFDNVLGAVDQPSWDGANMFFIAREARAAGLKVMLSGLGGDEVLAGYDFFHPGLLRRIAEFGLACLPARLSRSLNSGNKTPNYRAARLRDFIGQESEPLKWLSTLQWFPSALRNRVLTFPMRQFEGQLPVPPVLSHELNAVWRPAQRMNSLARLFMMTRMRMSFLADTDAMSMAHSQEVRVPFLDRQVVKAGWALTRTKKARDERKAVLRRLFREHSLPDLTPRKKKRGFQLPFQAWMRSSEPIPALKRFLAGQWEQAGIFGVEAKELVDNYCRGNRGVPWPVPYLLIAISDYVARHDLRN